MREPKVCVSFECAPEFEGRLIRMADSKQVCKSVLIRQILLEALTSFESSLSVNERYETREESNKSLINKELDQQARIMAMAMHYYKQTGQFK